MTKNIISILIFTSLFSFCQGQEVKLTFSPYIVTSQDSSVKAIAQLWEDYLNSIQEKQSDSIQKSFWHNNADDFIKYWNGGMVLYEFGEQFTFSIRKYTDNIQKYIDPIYEIHSLYLLPSMDEGANVLLMYKVCAVKTEGRFKLINYFDINKESLQSYYSKNIEFYYPSCGFNFDIEKANNVEQFINQFRNDYQIKKSKEKIICIASNSLNASNAIMGFDFSIATSEDRMAGYTLYPRTVFTCRQDHIHEFVHAVMLPEYPNALSILHEGIATYYGGTAGFDYLYHRDKLKSHINENPIDFSDISSFSAIIIDDNTYVLNTVGSLIMEYTLKNYGNQKVLELFLCEIYEAVFTKLGIKKEEINGFLTQLINGK
jgi:hypothetical protein